MPSEARRLHPLSFLFGVLSGLRKFALPGILVLIAGRAGSADSDNWERWQVWGMAFVVPYALYGLFRYLTLTYRLEPNEMVIRTGVLSKNERHVPYARIQNLDGVQNVLHRLLQVVEVRVDTGAGKEPEATLSVLPLADFEEMRRRVFAGRNAGAAAQAAEEAPPAARTLLHLRTRDLIFAGLIENRGTVIVAALFGLLWEVGLADGLLGSLLGEKSSGRGLVRSLLRGVFAGGGFPWERIALSVAAFGAFLLLVRVISMLWAWQRLHGFRLTRHGDDLRTEYGLLTRVVTTIPLHRIQALTLREGPFLRLLGCVAVKAETAGGGGEEGSGEEGKKQREWLAPILARDRLPGFVAEVLPGLDLSAVEWQAAPPRAFRREAKGGVLVAFLFSLPFLVSLKGWYVLLLALLLAWVVASARKTIEHLGWAVSGNAVLYRSGWLWRQVSVVPFAKIQAVTLAESPFDRRAAMARLRVDTAGAGQASHRVAIPYLLRETAEELGAFLATRAAGTAFRW